MNKYERVKAAIAKEPVDHVPACFSLHFPSDIAFGEAAVKAHLDFYRKTGVDILKVMNENFFPPIGKMDSPADWKKLPTYDRNAPFMKEQTELIKRIRDEEPDAYILGTIHGVCASSLHTIEEMYGYDPVRALFTVQLRTDPKAVLDARQRVADALCEYVRACVDAGCDGIYYAALGGEKRHFTDAEFDIAVKPYDLQVLSAIHEAGADVFLHICKNGLNMERYRGYGRYADVVNWGVYEAPLSLEEGERLFPGATIMGGLANRSGVMVNGTVEELKEEARRVIRAHGTTGFILGADCTLPTEIPLKRVRAVVEAAAEV